MTKFVAYYNLCSIHDPKEFLGIAPDQEDGSIITTLAKNIIVVIKISTQKQIRSWSVLEKLSCKVVFDRRSEKYVGVFANRTIRCWDSTVSDVNKVKKLKFQKGIADLISNGEDTYVLYSDGACELLVDAIEKRKEECTSKNQQHLDASNPHQPQLSDASIVNLPDGRQLLTYFVREPNKENLELVCLSLVPGGEPKRFSLKREKLNVQVAGYAVIEGDDSPMLLTIWSDKRIFLLSLHDNVDPEKSPGNFVSMLSILNVDSPMSVMGISRHFVAIYGANSGQEGASLLLYNTQFKVIKAKQFFKVYFDYSRLWAVNDNILLAMGQNLSVVTYRMSKELLAELLGTQSNNDFQTPIEGEHINEEDNLQECLQYTNKAAFIVNANNNASASMITEATEMPAADGKYVPFEPVQYFDNALRKLSQNHMHIELVQEEQPLEDISIALMSQCSDGLSFTGEVQLIARQLERCGASEHEITEKLLTVLIKANMLQNIAVCLQRYSNISEKMLAKTLSFVLTQYKPTNRDTQSPLNGTAEETETVSSVNGEEYLESADILATRAKFNTCETIEPKDVLNLVLSCAFDTATMTAHVRRELDYGKVVLLLEHLYNVLSTEDPSEMFVERPGCASPCIQTEMQAMRWFGILLNAHFQLLALSKDVHLIDLLFKWHELFTLYKSEIVELEQLAAMLHSIVQRKKISKEKNSSKWYSIEEVVLY